MAVSFDPHPAAVLRPQTFEGLLTLPQRRADLLRTAGADRVEFLHFTESMRAMTPDEFVDEVLVDRLAADAIVVGRDFTFGRAAAGTVATLETLAGKYGLTVSAVDLVGDGRAWSSTRARHAVLAGDVTTASDILGRPHRLSGVVVPGDRRGRELGYPTANLHVDEPLVVPADGVYSAILWHEGLAHPAAVSIGTNPTFEDVSTRRVEAHVIDRDDLALYGRWVEVDILEHVRDMVAFPDVDHLLAAMAADVEQARAHTVRYAADFAIDTKHW